MNDITINTTTAEVDTATGNIKSNNVETTTQASEFSHILATTHETIYVNRAEHEGLLPLMVLGNGTTCKVPTTTDPLFDQVPEWAHNDQISGANLAERRDFYVTRIGEEGYRTMMDTDVVDFNDIELQAWDHEENEVLLSPSNEWRMENLADKLGLDVTIEGWDASANDKDTIEELFTAQDAINPPTDEILEGIHETMFGETEAAQAATGTK